MASVLKTYLLFFIRVDHTIEDETQRDLLIIPTAPYTSQTARHCPNAPPSVGDVAMQLRQLVRLRLALAMARKRMLRIRHASRSSAAEHFTRPRYHAPPAPQ
jgi:hypothetical protein